MSPSTGTSFFIYLSAFILICNVVQEVSPTPVAAKNQACINAFPGVCKGEVISDDIFTRNRRRRQSEDSEDALTTTSESTNETTEEGHRISNEAVSTESSKHKVEENSVSETSTEHSNEMPETTPIDGPKPEVESTESPVDTTLSSITPSANAESEVSSSSSNAESETEASSNGASGAPEMTGTTMSENESTSTVTSETSTILSAESTTGEMQTQEDASTTTSSSTVANMTSVTESTGNALHDNETSSENSHDINVSSTEVIGTETVSTTSLENVTLTEPTTTSAEKVTSQAEDVSSPATIPGDEMTSQSTANPGEISSQSTINSTELAFQSTVNPGETTSNETTTPSHEESTINPGEISSPTSANPGEMTSTEAAAPSHEESTNATTNTEATSSQTTVSDSDLATQTTKPPSEEVTSEATTTELIFTPGNSTEVITTELPDNNTMTTNSSTDITMPSSTSVSVESSVSGEVHSDVHVNASSDKSDSTTSTPMLDATTTIHPSLEMSDKPTTMTSKLNVSEHSDHIFSDSFEFDSSLSDIIASPDYPVSQPLQPIGEILFDNYSPENFNKTPEQEEVAIIKQLSSPGCMYADKERFKRAMFATVYSKLDGVPTMLSFLKDTACIGTLSKKGHRTVRSRGMLIPQLPLKLKVEAGMFMHDRLYLFDSSSAQKVWSFKYNETKRIYSLKAHSVMSIDAFLQLCGIKDHPTKNFRVKAVAQFSLNDPTCILYDRKGNSYLSENATLEATSLADSIHFLMNTQFINRIQSIFSWMDEPSSKSVYVYGSDGELYELYRDDQTRSYKIWTAGKFRRIPYENAPIPKTD